MPSIPHHILIPGASRRMEALSDGIFAIAATILVLEIRVPKLKHGFTTAELEHSLLEVLPSFIAFVFSFLNILIFWVNHDAINKVIRHYDVKTTYLNILFLLCISLIPFTTAFVSEYPFSQTAITCYGLVLFFSSLIAVLMYRHLAFRSSSLLPAVTMASRKRIWNRVAFSPLLYVAAILLGFIHVYIPIIIYIIMPVAFMFLPQMDFEEQE